MRRPTNKGNSNDASRRSCIKDKGINHIRHVIITSTNFLLIHVERQNIPFKSFFQKMCFNLIFLDHLKMLVTS